MPKFMIPTGHIVTVTELHSRAFEVHVPLNPSFIMEFDFYPCIPDINSRVQQEIKRRARNERNSHRIDK